WSYEQGTELRDPSMKEVADYYARLVSWYTQGGFTDQYGKRYESGHHYKIQYWEILNEVEIEHRMSPEFYTHLYDAVAGAIHKVDPDIKFVGAALAFPSTHPKFLDYFLNPRNHKPGIPLDMVSYHFYAHPTPGQDLNDWQYTFFDQADHFLDTVRYIQTIRERLSPRTETDADELGCILPYDTADHLVRKIPNGYWNLCGAMYAYVYAQLAHLGVEVAGESQLVGYPTQFPSVSMVNWKTGQPNARFWVLKLLDGNFGPGDKLVKTEGGSEAVYAQGFVTPSGQHKVLLINKRNRPAFISLPGAAGSQEQYVDEETGENGVAKAMLVRDQTILGPFEVSVVTLR
ncbi:MAG: glycosyl hydrolase family 39, partial [Acidobacteriota bacterium]